MLWLGLALVQALVVWALWAGSVRSLRGLLLLEHLSELLLLLALAGWIWTRGPS